jgi:hypothetical protein
MSHPCRMSRHHGVTATVHRTCPSQSRGADATPSSLPVQAELVVGLARELAHRPPLRPRPRGRTGRHSRTCQILPPNFQGYNRPVPTRSLEGSTARSAHQPPRLRTPLSGGGDLDDLSAAVGSPSSCPRKREENPNSHHFACLLQAHGRQPDPTWECGVAIHRLVVFAISPGQDQR